MNTSTIARLLLIAAIAVALPTAALAQTALPASPASPFLPLSHPEALAQAAAQNKPLLLVFTASWSADSRALLAETFSAPSVAPLLRERTLAVTVDVVGQPALTTHHRVRSAPTTLLLAPDGRLLRRWDGFVPPARFAKDLTDELSGKTALAKLRRSFFPRSPAGYLKLARKLDSLGYPEAGLAELHWLRENVFADEWIAGRFDHFAYPRVLDEIARIDPSALIGIRGQEYAATLADPASAAHARRFSAVCSKLGDTESIFELYRTLPDGHARHQLHRDIFPMLIDRREYPAAVATLKNVEHALALAARHRESDLKSRFVLRIFSPTGRYIRKSQLRAVTRRAVFFEAYAGARLHEEARIVAASILAWDRLGTAPTVLRHSALQALGPETDAFLASLNLPALAPSTAPLK